MISFLDILFPKKCIYCGKEGKYICEKCLKSFDNKYIFRKVFNNYFDYMFCCSFYTDIIKNQIHSFKFHEKAYLYEYFIELSLRNNISDFLKKFDLVTFIPMNYNKEIRRGYNQSKLLAKELGKRLNINVINTLEKEAGLFVQSTLSEKDRENNAKKAFKILKNINIENKNIILVDDIFTTGSTVKSASKILKENKANKICVFAISKTRIRRKL